MAFARQLPLNAKVIDLNDLVRTMTDMLKRTLGETIQISTELAPELGKTMADPAQVHNALLNLAINARDAMPEGGKLTIETSNIDLNTEAAEMRVDASPGHYVRLSVRDTGVGMPDDVRARVFEPFFTTREKGKGTGLGLSMVHGFAKQSGGHLDLYSEVGHGTAVSLYLPDAGNDAEANTDGAAPSSPDDARGETVLVVEDDPRVRKITVRRLKHLGYQIIEAESGPGALDLLSQSNPVDVLLTDMVMPGGMTGFDLVREVRKTYPDIKVALTSGYAEDGTMPDDGTPWLRKPYTLHELAGALRQLLG